MLLGCGRGHSCRVLFDFKGLWQILDGPHRLTARHISHATCQYTVAGRDEEMLTFCIGSTAAAWHLPLLLFAALLCWQGGGVAVGWRGDAAFFGRHVFEGRWRVTLWAELPIKPTCSHF